MADEARNFTNVRQVVDLFVSKTAFWNEKIFNALLDARLANETSEQLEFLVKTINRTESLEYKQHFITDVWLFAKDAMLNQTNMKHTTWAEWTDPQEAYGALCWGYGIFWTLVWKFFDERLARWYGAKHGIKANLCQRVIVVYFIRYNFICYHLN